MRVQRPSNPRCNAEYNPQCNPPPTPRQRGCDTHPHTPMRCTALRRACTQPSGRPQSLGAALARTDVQPPFALRSGPNGGRCSKGGRVRYLASAVLLNQRPPHAEIFSRCVETHRFAPHKPLKPMQNHVRSPRTGARIRTNWRDWKPHDQKRRSYASGSFAATQEEGRCRSPS